MESSIGVKGKPAEEWFRGCNFSGSFTFSALPDSETHVHWKCNETSKVLEQPKLKRPSDTNKRVKEISQSYIASQNAIIPAQNSQPTTAAPGALHNSQLATTVAPCGAVQVMQSATRQITSQSERGVVGQCDEKFDESIEELDQLTHTCH